MEPFTPDAVAAICGIPAEVVVEMAHAYATADKAQILWTLGHHRAPQRGGQRAVAVQSGPAYRPCGSVGLGLVPLRGQNNVQGGGDMGAIPNKFPGFASVDDPDHRIRFEAAYGGSSTRFPVGTSP